MSRCQKSSAAEEEETQVTAVERGGGKTAGGERHVGFLLVFDKLRLSWEEVRAQDEQIIVAALGSH